MHLLRIVPALAAALPGAALLTLVGGAVFGVIGSIIAAAILHVLALLFGGKAPFSSLYIAMSHGNGLVSWASVLPGLGHLAAFVWGIVVAVTILEEVHGLERGKAVAVVLIPAALLLLCACAALMFSGLAILSALGLRHT